jgi:cystathionine beta-lyase
MLFIDCREWLGNHGKTLDELLRMGWDVGVIWQDGRQHGGDMHIRINLALPLSRVKEAFDRMNKYVFNAK